MTVTGEVRMVLISACFLHPIALKFIGSKWSDCHWEIQNGADLCLSVTLFFFSHSQYVSGLVVNGNSEWC